MTLKDYIVKSFTVLIWLWIVVYTVRLYLNDRIIVPDALADQNMIAVIFVIVIWLFLIALAARESLLPNNRRGVLLLGMGIIRSSHIYLADTPDMQVYLRDIMKLVWVFLCIAGPMKLLISANYAEQKFEEEVEIIEV